MNILKYHSFLDPLQQETLQTWDKLADLYWDKFSAIRLYDASYDAFYKSYPGWLNLFFIIFIALD